MDQQMELETIRFQNDEIVILKHDGKNLVGLKSAVENLGLNWEAQRRKVLSNPVLEKGTLHTVFPSQGGAQKTLLMEFKFFLLYLGGINSAKVKAEIKPKLESYQLELPDVLEAHFFGMLEQRKDQAKELKTIYDLPKEQRELYTETFRILQTWWKLSIGAAVKQRVAPENVIQFAINYMQSVTNMDLDIGEFLVAKNCRLLIDPDGNPQLKPVRGETSTLVWAETDYGWVRSIILDKPRYDCSVYWVAEDVCQLFGGTIAEYWSNVQQKVKHWNSCPVVNAVISSDRYLFNLKNFSKVVNENGLRRLVEKSEYERSKEIPELLLDATQAAKLKVLEKAA